MPPAASIFTTDILVDPVWVPAFNFAVTVAMLLVIVPSQTTVKVFVNGSVPVNNCDAPVPENVGFDEDKEATLELLNSSVIFNAFAALTAEPEIVMMTVSLLKPTISTVGEDIVPDVPPLEDEVIVPPLLELSNSDLSTTGVGFLREAADKLSLNLPFAFPPGTD